MNTPFHPFRPALQPLGHPLLPSAAQSVRKTAPLSARQMLDAELGLFLLSQLQPTARPDELPHLLAYQPDAPAEGQTLTPRQHKYLNRGRALLGQYQHLDTWQQLLRRYATYADHRQAYDLPTDLSRFRQKTVGFFRNRVTTFKQVLS